jgi:hypothetical protein
MSSQQYLGEDQNLADLASRMQPDEREQYESFSHLRVDPGYIGRIYVLYKPTGLTADGLHRDPEVLGQVKIVDWYADAINGAAIVVEDMTTGQTLVVGHTPKRLFEYDVFIAVPPYQRLRFEARNVGRLVKRSLLFSVLIKTRVRSSFYSKGVSFCEAPKGFSALYPSCQTAIKFI